MTIGALGSLALAAGVIALMVLPLGIAWRVGPVRHPDGTALREAGWAHGFGRWEALRAASMLAGVAIAGVLGGPPVLGLLAGVGPSIVIRLKADAARDHARSAVAQLLVTAHAMLRSGVALPEALRRASAGCDDLLARRPFELAITRFDLGDPLDAWRTSRAQ